MYRQLHRPFAGPILEGLATPGTVIRAQVPVIIVLDNLGRLDFFRNLLRWPGCTPGTRCAHLVGLRFHALHAFHASPVLGLGRRRLHIDLFNINGCRWRFIRKYHLTIFVHRAVDLLGNHAIGEQADCKYINGFV
jgi:hypothetical protein